MAPLGHVPLHCRTVTLTMSLPAFVIFVDLHVSVSPMEHLKHLAYSTHISPWLELLMRFLGIDPRYFSIVKTLS